MTPRDNLATALEGGTPDRTPLSMYAWFADSLPQDEVKRLIDQGLVLSRGVGTYRIIEHGTENRSGTFTQDGVEHWFFERVTPVGTLRTSGPKGWTTEHYIKEPADYRIFQWIVEHSQVEPMYESYEAAVAAGGAHTFHTLGLSRSPAMTINVDLCGTEQFCMDVAMEVPELFDLYHALRRRYLEEVKVVAAGPGRVVQCIENLTISMLGPDRYRDLLMRVYEEVCPILHAGGKRITVHYDGALRAIADQIAQAPFDGIESLTEPPEGDMLYDDCRRLWPDKVLWAHINVDCYALPPQQLIEAVVAKRQRAGKRALAFEISEDVPRNWRESIPLVLRTLESLN